MTQQTIAKPLPCPFCGGEKVSIHEGSTYRWAFASCDECGASAGDIRRQYGQGVDDPEVIADAIAAWNTRAAPMSLDDRLSCQREIAALQDKLHETSVERLGYKEAYDEQAAAHIQTRRELADARAEIARLKPAAEAWEALEARSASAKIEIALAKTSLGTDAYEQAKKAFFAVDDTYRAAAARARGAK